MKYSFGGVDQGRARKTCRRFRSERGHAGKWDMDSPGAEKMEGPGSRGKRAPQIEGRVRRKWRTRLGGGKNASRPAGDERRRGKAWPGAALK
jgi:hypothetical protein